MQNDKLAISVAFEKALADFLRDDLCLLLNNVKEETICATLARHMGKYYSFWDVDCEYDKIGDQGHPKLIDRSRDLFLVQKEQGIIPPFIRSWQELQSSKNAVKVYPDIVVHHRGDPLGNLLDVEVKKSTNTELLLGWDEFKIRFFMEVLGYQSGLFLVFNTGKALQKNGNPIHTKLFF